MNANPYPLLSSSFRSRPRFEHRFTTITYNQQRFRILAREHHMMTYALQTWRAVWVIISCALYGAILHSIGSIVGGQQMMPPIIKVIFMFATIGLGWGCSLVWKHRQKVGNMTKFSTTNCFILFLLCTILVFANLPFLKYPTLLFICAETIGSLFFLYNRSQLMGKFFIMLQFLLINMKIDGQIRAGWQQILFGFLLGHVIGLIAFFSMLVFFIVNTCYFREAVSSVKHIGLGFIALHSLSMTLTCDAPIVHFFFNIPHFIVCLMALGVNLFNVYYSKKFFVEITLFLCKTETVKSYNQIISLAIIDKKQYQGIVFVKKSDHWYEKVKLMNCGVNKLENTIELMGKNQKTSEFKSTSQILNEEFEIEERDKCLICMEMNPCVVWSPCGHLTVCEICCDKMLEKKTSDCLLCKSSPQAIYHVQYPQNQSILSVEEISSEKSIGKSPSINITNEGLPQDKQFLVIKSGYSLRIC